MTRFFAVVIATALAGCGGWPQHVAGPYDMTRPRDASPVPGDTLVNLVVSARITSRMQANASVGYVLVASDVVVDGATRVRAGTPVQTRVMVDGSGGGGRPGCVRLESDSVPDVEGKLVRLRQVQLERCGKRRTGGAVGLGLGLTPLLGPFAWFFFGLNGREVEIPQGTTLVTSVDGPLARPHAIPSAPEPRASHIVDPFGR